MDFNITDWNRVSLEAFKSFGYDSGMVVKNFDPTKFEIPKDEDILATTTGNITASLVPTYEDLGADVNGVRGEYAELKILVSWAATMGFTVLELNKETLKMAAGAADIEGMSVKARMQLMMKDFETIAIILPLLGGGLAAIVLYNSLSTGGVNLTTTKGGKSQNALTLTGHQTFDAQNQVPMEFYVAGGTVTPEVNINHSNITVEVEKTALLRATTVPSDATVTWSTSDGEVATVEDGVVTGVSAGTATITATITVEGTSYTDTCRVTVTNPENDGE